MLIRGAGVQHISPKSSVTSRVLAHLVLSEEAACALSTQHILS